LSEFCLRGFHPLWPAVPCRSAIRTRSCCRPHDPLGLASQGLGRSAFASSPSWLLVAMYSLRAGGHSPAGFPHSEISGSMPVSGSPELIAAVHVLHRLWLPRHPPYALCSLTLSLRHASSRARDSTVESSELFVLLLRTILRSTARHLEWVSHFPLFSCQRAAGTGSHGTCPRA
jgi:hypothetical protein